MLKVGYWRGSEERGPVCFPLFGRQDGAFEKTAAPTLLPDVSQYISDLRPKNNSQYVLVNALGAGEYWGANVNADHFPEAALIHAPNDWSGNPVVDIPRSKNWHYGFPTFYYAHPYAHHRNKDSSRAFGEVELATWNTRMKRVELVVRVDYDKCQQFGGIQVWDKIKIGEFPDVSMGSKVPFDTCSICLDWKTYRKAQASFDPKVHPFVGAAVLKFHRDLKAKGERGIRGLAITRAEYCDHMRYSPNKILPDGQKVFVYNDYPRFFDISFVFIGADKTAKTMLHIKTASRVFSWSTPGAELAEQEGYADEGEKTAAELDKSARVRKESEIIKDVIPSQFAGRAIPLLTDQEKKFPRALMARIRQNPAAGLATTGGLGIILQPDEFEEISDQCGHCPPFASGDFDPLLAALLRPVLANRSALGPCVRERILMVVHLPEHDLKRSSSFSEKPLRKMAAYEDYRRRVMDLVAAAPDLLPDAGILLTKEAHVSPEDSLNEYFPPITVAYLKYAYADQAGVTEWKIDRPSLSGEGIPLGEHGAMNSGD